MQSKKYPCPCCGYYTISEMPPGTFEICPVCFWEDDNVQYVDPDFEGGANDVSLNKAKVNFNKFRAKEEKYLKLVRDPLDEEK